MRELRILVILLFLAHIYIGVYAQKGTKAVVEDTVMMDDAKANPTNLVKARFQINDVKTRGIIVRLKTNQERITAYRKEGYKKVADKLEERSRATNLLLEYAFITYWTYSPVYFMESQHTSTLIKKDSLIAKTFDLKRDTSIYMNHDSFYIVDYGDLMVNDEDETHPLKYSKASNNIIPGNFLVIKDHHQEQLQPPMPYYTKMWVEELSSSNNLEPIDSSMSLTDSIKSYLLLYKNTNDLYKGDSKFIARKYLDSVYKHIQAETKKGSTSYSSTPKLSDEFQSNYMTIVHEVARVVGKGNPYQKGVNRLNKYFIAYYCKRLDKDHNILCDNDPYYWWQRNPNIRYLPYLRDLEIALKSALDSDLKPTM